MRLLALGLLLLAWSASAQQTPSQLFDSALGDPIELDARGSSTEVIVPLTAAAGLTAGDTLQPPLLQDVSLSNRHDGVFRKALAVSWFTQEGVPTPLGLKVQVDLDTLVDTGTYTVMVILRATGAQTKSQLLSFQLTLPPASLAAVATLKLEDEGFLLSSGDAVATKLLLHETTRRSRLTGVELHDRSGGGGLRVQRQVAPQDNSVPPLVVGAGETVFVPLEVTGTRTLGVHSGTLSLQAPQLASPLEVAYEVTLRHPKWMILVVLVGGLLIGQLARVVLKNRIDKRSAQADLLKQWRRLEEEMSRYPDAGYRGKLQAIAEKLTQAASGSVEEMGTALQNARKDLEQAQKELKELKPAVVAEVERLKQLLQQVWQLPAQMMQVLVQVGQAVADASARVDTDPTRALVDLETAEGTLQSSLFPEAGTWRRTLLAQASLDPLPLKRELQERLNTGWSALQESVKLLPATPGELESQTLLRTLHDSFEKARTFCELLRRQLVPLVENVLKMLEPNQQDPRSLEDLRTRTRLFAQRQNDWESPEGPGGLYREAKALLEAVSGLILDNTPLEERTAATKQLEAGLYEEVAQATVSMKGLPLSFTTGGEAILEARGRLSASVLPDTHFRDALSATLSHVTGSRESPLLSLEQIEARNWRRLFREQLLRSTLLGTILVLAAYVFFEKSFIGTFTDYATLFFWAFATDATVEAVDRVAAPFKKPLK